MANRDCNGDYFSAKGVRYYRCFWDGTVVPAPDQMCPVCHRVIDAVGQYGDVPVVGREYAKLPDDIDALLPQIDGEKR